MKNILLPLCVAVALVGAAVAFQRSSDTPESEEGRISKKDRIDKAISQEYERTKDLRSGIVPKERLLAAVAFRDAKLAERNNAGARSVGGISWQERGPNNVAGRTRALLFDRNDAANGFKKVWAGGVGGGLWFTNDITVAAPVWNKVNDLMDNLAITCLIQHPTNLSIMYAGTGEGWFNGGAVKGLGIWKTTDGGMNWTRLTSTFRFSYVNDLVIDANGHLYAAVREHIAGDARGVQKSTDGGTTWTEVFSSTNGGAVSDRAADLEISANGDLYASVGQYNNGGIYRSNFATHGAATGNAGTWTNITPNAAGIIAAPSNLWRRIEIATAPSDGAIMYAVFEGTGTLDCTSIQQYNSTTNTWTVRTVPTIIDQGFNSIFTRDQAWYDLTVAVDPNNASSLYVAGIDALRSDDGGANWTQMTTWSLFAATGFTAAQLVHADQHAIVYAPGSSSRALWGTDGGVHYTANANSVVPAKPSFASKNSGYNVTQFYSVAMHPSLSNYFLAGAQDNGTQRFVGAAMNATTEATGGDGSFCHIDQDNPSVQITSYVYNEYHVSTDGGTNFTNRRFNTEGSFINPTDYDNAGNKLYAGSKAGHFFRWNNPAVAGTDTNTVSCVAFAGGRITHVAVSPTIPNRVFFGLHNGLVVMVDNAHTGSTVTGTVVRSGTGSVSCIAIEQGNEDHALVTYSNYGQSSVFECSNVTAASPTWTDVEGNLPDMPVYWAMFDPRNSDWALIATDLGVWSTDDLSGAATDWDPTNSGLANVRVDMLQYRASDRTIAAATHGRGLFTAVVPTTITPDINFSTATSATTEAGASAGCLSYRDITIPVTIANPPTGDATITYAVSASTATAGVDYSFTTNGNFTAPSLTHTFGSGSTDAQQLTVRIYDDAAVEGAESFTISYSISGTTDARAGIGAQTHTVTILDNDKAPGAGSTTTHAIGAGNTGADFESPFRSDVQKHRTQTLYTRSELQASGMSSGGLIQALTLRTLTKNSTKPFNGFTISIGHTTASNLGTGFVAADFTQVYSNTYSTVVGNNSFSFSTPFVWDGTSNIVVQYCFDNGTAAADPLPDRTRNTAAPLGAGVPGSCFSEHMPGDPAAGCELDPMYISPSRPNVTFTFNIPATPIASTLNTTRSENVAPNTDQYFYSPSGELLARIRNTGTHAFGCTGVTVDRAGTGASPFVSNNPANYLMNKTFQVVPTTNNTAGQYEITLYYTNAEKLGWEAATGQSWSSIQLIKVASRIGLYSPSSPNPDGGGVQMVTPVIGTFGTNHTLTYTFTTGFSGFGAGVPGIVLPVTLTSFDGILQGDAVQLKWSTVNEKSLKYFEVEKSTDGALYQKLGTVAAKSVSGVHHYDLRDHRLSEANYYRLRMFDYDGKSTLSKVVFIRKAGTAPKVWVMTNPFRTAIDLKFADVPGSTVHVELRGTAGNLLFRRTYTRGGDNLRIDLSSLSLASGTYLLKVACGGKWFNAKVIKQ